MKGGAPLWAVSEQPNRHAVGMPSHPRAIFIEQISGLFLGSGPRNRVHRTSSRTFKTSGSSEAWYRARFGTERSRVRIPPSRPLTHGFTEPAAVESAAGQPEIRPN